MPTLYLAEKPSLGRTIARALGRGRAGEGQIRGDGWVVSWCVGHLYEQAMPEDYDPALKRWSRERLPIIPEQWKLTPKREHRGQIAVIKKLLAEADRVVHCGDPDREGQLLVDEVLEQLRWRGPVARAWLPDLTDAALKRALSQLQENERYRGLSNAARGRSRADWLVGMNLSRAMTLANRAAGGDALISIGRVQTPTLKLVVERDRLIEAFVPTDHFQVHARFAQQGNGYPALWQPGEAVADEEGRCLRREEAEAVAARIAGQAGEIVTIEQKEKREPPPLPFSLNELQQAASKRLGFSAQQTLDVAQALYERHKLISYPRTDCRFLAADQHKEAPAVLAALAGNGFAKEAQGADPKRRGRAFDDKKITAHTAIVPTANSAGRLGRDEAALYDMIVRTYLAQFHPDHRYQASRVETRCAGERFVTKGKQVREEGWKVLFPKADKKTREGEEEACVLPPLAKGAVQCLEAKVEAKRTQPPAPYTEGSLIKAMANVARFVDDERLRKVLRENQGIGTEATRAGIIETLKKRGFIRGEGKALRAAPLGRQVVEQSPEQLSNPAITAWWEQLLGEVERGEIPLARFEARAVQWLRRLLEAVEPGRIREPMRGEPRRFTGKRRERTRRPAKGGRPRPAGERTGKAPRRRSSS
ncbi:DNA topoisomerase III [Endothiovibrio diazotrophicus]